MIFREAQEKDDAQLTELFAKPMPGDLSLSFTRTPGYLESCARFGPRRRVLSAVEGDEVLALCSFFLWPYSVAGKRVEVWTVADFRALDRAAHRSVTGRGWKALRGLLEGRPAMISVVDDNPISGPLFAKRRRGWPELRPVARLQTLMFPLLGEYQDEIGVVCPAVERLCEFLNGDERELAPHILPGHLGRVAPAPEDFLGVTDGAGLRACGALWDPCRFRQTRVAGYRGFYASLRRWSQKLGLDVMPEPGSKVAVGFASFLRGEEEALERVARALCHRARQRGLSFLVWGGDAREKSPFPRHWPRFTYPSTLYQLVWEGDDPLKVGEGPCGYEVAWL